MTNRRRRWLRRIAIGISFAVFAAPAAAKPVPAVNSNGPLAAQERASVRPDNRADRFAISDAASPATSGTTASVSWDGAVTLGLGTLVLVLALGLGLGYVRRPKVARI